MTRLSTPFATGTTVVRFLVQRRRGWVFGKMICSSVSLCSRGELNRHLAGEYKLKMTECAELCRVALTSHATPVSRIISIAVKMLKRAMPGLRLIVSFADPERRHIGVPYQAAGWVYVGESVGASCVMVNGKVTHRRTISSKYRSSSVEWLQRHVDANARAVWTKPKHKYLLPLDDEMRRKILPLSKPYPKRAVSKEALRLETIQEGAVRI